jgi:hypothetical protein
MHRELMQPDCASSAAVTVDTAAATHHATSDPAAGVRRPDPVEAALRGTCSSLPTSTSLRAAPIVAATRCRKHTVRRHAVQPASPGRLPASARMRRWGGPRHSAFGFRIRAPAPQGLGGSAAEQAERRTPNAEGRTPNAARSP